MSAVRFRRVAVIVAVAAAVTGITPLAPAGSGTTVSAPFSWEGASWCPNYYGIQSWETCGAPTSSGTASSAAFYPSQVSYTTSSAPISLEMNAAATESGAFNSNSETQETWSAPATLSEEINLPCDGSEIENWPAFRLVTTGSWPKGGEIDVMEGLSGQAEWHYHYLSAQGVDSHVGGSLGSGCGTNYYGVKWTTSAITFYYNGTAVGAVTPKEIGVPIASGPMFLVNDYAASSDYGGPTVGGVSMEVFNLTPTIQS